MTQKKLIDYCNSTPWHHCMNGCPYENKECDAYGRKYNCDTPAYMTTTCIRNDTRTMRL